MTAVADSTTAEAAPRQRARRGARSTGSACPAGFRPRRSPWCSLFFFVMPLILVVIVSFWDYNDYEMLPSFTTRSYTESFDGCLTKLPDLCTIFKTYVSTAKFCFIVWVTDARHRLHRRLFPRLLRALGDHADGAVPRLHDPVLDLERDPHDLLDSAARPQRPRQPGADPRAHRRHAGRMAALFAILGRRSPSSTSSPSSWWCRSSIR